MTTTICDGQVWVQMITLVPPLPAYMFVNWNSRLGKVLIEKQPHDLYVENWYDQRIQRIVADPGVWGYGPEVVYHWCRCQFPDAFEGMPV